MIVSEEWKDIKDYEGIYQISTLGRVKRVDRTFKRADGREYHYSERIIAQGFTHRGYRVVKLSNYPKSDTKVVHRLIMNAFTVNTNPLYDQINHIDGNKANNNIENLEWIDQTGNINHSLYLGLRYTRKVKCVETGEIYISTREAGRKNNSGHKEICTSCKIGNAAKGKHFQYVT